MIHDSHRMLPGYRLGPEAIGVDVCAHSRCTNIDFFVIEQTRILCCYHHIYKNFSIKWALTSIFTDVTMIRLWTWLLKCIYKISTFLIINKKVKSKYSKFVFECKSNYRSNTICHFFIKKSTIIKAVFYLFIFNYSSSVDAMKDFITII